MSWVLCNKRECTPVVEWCLEEVLGMKNYELNVNYQTILTCGGYFERPNLVFVGHAYDSYGEDRRREFHTLFHELRHYYQYKTQMFSFDYRSYYSPTQPGWSEERIKMERYMDYLNFPWELDAQAFAMETLREFWKTPMGQEHKPKPTPAPKQSAISHFFNFSPVQADPSYPTFC